MLMDVFLQKDVYSDTFSTRNFFFLSDFNFYAKNQNALLFNSSIAHLSKTDKKLKGTMVILKILTKEKGSPCEICNVRFTKNSLAILP
jgi:hypothetical protein